MSLDPSNFFNVLKKNEIEFFTGVPDSLLKDFCLCIDENISSDKHIIAANEGNAIAIASGYHLANNSVPLVYMQNSGMGNAVNPILSLCDPDVYGIPLLMMIGWRGEPGVSDEPQHIKQGKVQEELLKAMGIDYEIISSIDNQKDIEKKVIRLIEIAKANKIPVALLVKKGTFNKFTKDSPKKNKFTMKREDALKIILDEINQRDVIVSTTGKTSREIFEIRKIRKQSHKQDFLTVGSMGHCSSISLGISLAKPAKKVYCIDGDGSMIMHLGSITTIASLKPKNLKYILLNNHVHESVGGQETAAKDVSLLNIVKSLEVFDIFKAENISDLKDQMKNLIETEKPSFLEVKIKPGSRDNLGRPTIKPSENKKSFMKFLAS